MLEDIEIAEMAVVGCHRNPQAYTADECMKCEFKNGMCDAYKHAEKLYQMKYRKIGICGYRPTNERISKAIEEIINS